MNKTVVLSGIIAAVFLMSGCGKHNKSQSALEPEVMMDDMNSALSNEVTVSPAGNEQVAVGTNMMAPTEAMTTYDPSEPFVKPTHQEVQEALKNAGLYTGKIDGVAGSRTKKAIRDFQAQNNLNADGRVGPQTWAKLAPYLHQSSSLAAPAPEPAASADNVD